jgi:outer membrane protein TolC
MGTAGVVCSAGEIAPTPQPEKPQKCGFFFSDRMSSSNHGPHLSCARTLAIGLLGTLAAGGGGAAAEGLRLQVSASLAAAIRPTLEGAPFLSQLATRAIEFQPAIGAADATRRADAERVEQARGALRPQLTGLMGVQREFADAGSVQPFTGVNAGLRLAFPLYRPQAGAAIGQAESQLRSSEFARAESQREVLARVVDAYLLAALAEEEGELLQSERVLLLRQKVINERRVSGGVGTRVEVMEAEARAESVQAQALGSGGALRQQLVDLERLAAMPVTRVRRIRAGEPPQLVPADPDQAVATARERNATLARLAAAYDAARGNIDVQRAGSSPTVDLFGNYDQGRNYFNQGSQAVPSALFGVQVAVPISSGGVIESRVREALARADRAEAELRDADLSLRGDMRRAYIDLDRARAQWNAQRVVLDTARQTLEATTKAFAQVCAATSTCSMPSSSYSRRGARNCVRGSASYRRRRAFSRSCRA